MGDHKTRTRKLVVGFSTLPEESNTILLERMEELNKAETVVLEKQMENHFFAGFPVVETEN